MPNQIPAPGQAARSITIQGPLLDQASVCEPVLRSLPGWFGIEEAIQEYLRLIDHLPTFLAFDPHAAGKATGFLTVKRHFPQAAELYVMGVLPDSHRQGIGRRLVEAAEGMLRREGVEFFQVKTLAPSHPDEGYARTRLFYQALGFRPLEVFPTLWGAANPCLLMVKYLLPEV